MIPPSQYRVSDAQFQRVARPKFEYSANCEVQCTSLSSCRDRSEATCRRMGNGRFLRTGGKRRQGSSMAVVRYIVGTVLFAARETRLNGDLVDYTYPGASAV